ncbi:hypothetical protein [Propionivibrio sp.]|uniref:hypothetical protein n=1 Tax=Propionivibrio sp. TaxID=2212460 RepID=UPI002607EEAE|nr:hypothetical protein [Propionivibrio sp.]
MNMIKLGKTVGAALVIGALFATLPACQKQEGPAERAGKEVDKAADKVGQKIEKAGEKIQDAAKK